MKLRTDHDIPAPAYPNGTGTRPVAARRPGRTASGWVAEAPEAHLLPHFQAACDEAGSLLHLDEAWSDDEIFVVELSATKPDLSVGHLRHAAIVLAAAIAEESTSIASGATAIFSSSMLRRGVHMRAGSHLTATLSVCGFILAPSGGSGDISEPSRSQGCPASVVCHAYVRCPTRSRNAMERSSTNVVDASSYSSHELSVNR
jgi:hypothetical protein